MNVCRVVFTGIMLLSGFSACATETNHSGCFSNNWTKDKYLALKADGFDASDEVVRNLVPQLQYCLASVDPEIRDAVAYEAYFSWLRAGKVSARQLYRLFESFTKTLESGDKDKHGVYLPFVALVYSEVLRVDRVDRFLTDVQRQSAVDAITGYLSGISDYRGFDERVGWRHGVAHSADVILQLVLNKALSTSQIRQLADAIALQVNPSTLHFYIYGEPERLARAAGYGMLREEVPVAFWHAWLEHIASPAPFDSWTEVFMSQSGLAKRNNTRQFLSHLYGMIADSENTRLKKITPVIRELLRKTG